jgi:hypothetical protein
VKKEVRTKSKRWQRRVERVALAEKDLWAERGLEANREGLCEREIIKGWFCNAKER